jgi:hypothetical protein
MRTGAVTCSVASYLQLAGGDTRASPGSMTVHVVNIRGVFVVVLDPAVMMNV